MKIYVIYIFFWTNIYIFKGKEKTKEKEGDQFRMSLGLLHTRLLNEVVIMMQETLLLVFFWVQS